MNNANRFVFYKELYFRELDRRSQIDSSVAVPATIVIAIFGAIGFLINSAIIKNPRITEFYFWIPLVVSTIAALRSSWFLLKTYNRAVYTELSFPNSLEEYYHKLKHGEVEYLAQSTEYRDQISSFLQDNPNEYEPGLLEVVPFDADEKYLQFIIEELAERTTENKIVNSARGLNLHFAMTSVYFSLAFLVVAWIAMYLTISQS